MPQLLAAAYSETPLLLTTMMAESTISTTTTTAARHRTEAEFSSVTKLKQGISSAVPVEPFTVTKPPVELVVLNRKAPSLIADCMATPPLYLREPSRWEMAARRVRTNFRKYIETFDMQIPPIRLKYHRRKPFFTRQGPDQRCKRD